MLCHHNRDRRQLLGLLSRLGAALLPALRRVGGGWLGAVARVLAQLLFEPLDPRLQAGDLALVALTERLGSLHQLEDRLDGAFPPGVVDGLCLGALHAARFDIGAGTPALCQPSRCPPVPGGGVAGD